MAVKKSDDQILDEYIKLTYPNEIIADAERKIISETLGFAKYVFQVRVYELSQEIIRALHI